MTLTKKAQSCDFNKEGPIMTLTKTYDLTKRRPNHVTLTKKAQSCDFNKRRPNHVTLTKEGPIM